VKQFAMLNELACIIPGASVIAGVNKTCSRRWPWNPNFI